MDCRSRYGGIVAAALVATWSALLGGCGPITFTVGSGPADRPLTATVVESDGGRGGDRVALIDISGLIINSSRRGLLSQSDNPVGVLHEKLREARRDRRVKAVILRLNTPGGTVTASDAMYREIRRFRSKTGKPVVALMMDVAASGGYYVACATDEIVAYPTAVTGSIGVILQTISLEPALTRWGITAEAITTGPNKGAGSLLTELTDENRAMLQAMVDDFYARFVEVVRDARPGIPDERFATVTDGRVLSGVDAAEVGLVDEVGDLHDAFALAKRLAGVTRADLVMYHRQGGYAGSPYARAPVDAAGGRGMEVNLLQVNLPDSLAEPRMGFYYLWRPTMP